MSLSSFFKLIPIGILTSTLISPSWGFVSVDTSNEVFDLYFLDNNEGSYLGTASGLKNPATDADYNYRSIKWDDSIGNPYEALPGLQSTLARAVSTWTNTFTNRATDGTKIRIGFQFANSNTGVLSGGEGATEMTKISTKKYETGDKANSFTVAEWFLTNGNTNTFTTKYNSQAQVTNHSQENNMDVIISLAYAHTTVDSATYAPTTQLLDLDRIYATAVHELGHVLGFKTDLYNSAQTYKDGEWQNLPSGLMSAYDSLLIGKEGQALATINEKGIVEYLYSQNAAEMIAHEYVVNTDTVQLKINDDLSIGVALPALDPGYIGGVSLEHLFDKKTYTILEEDPYGNIYEPGDVMSSNSVLADLSYRDLAVLEGLGYNLENPSPTPTPIFPIPEPSSISLLVFSLFLFMSKRSRQN